MEAKQDKPKEGDDQALLEARSLGLICCNMLCLMGVCKAAAVK